MLLFLGQQLTRVPCAGVHTAFMYIEADILLSWPALVSWARDTELLSPLGFQRAMYRVEVAPWDGKYVMLDAFQGRLTALKAINFTDIAADQHSHYLQLNFSYMGLWVYTRAQLAQFMQTARWSGQGYIGTKQTREHAAWGYQQESPPAGFEHNNMVPYDAKTRQLHLVAAVEHLANNYAHSAHAALFCLWSLHGGCS